MSREGATIRREQRKSRRVLVAEITYRLNRLEEIYRQALDDIEERLAAAAAGGDIVPRAQLGPLRDYFRARLADLATARDELLDEGMQRAVQIAATPWAGSPAVANRMPGIAERALQFVREFVHRDGLALSDRIWRLNTYTRETLTQAVESLIVRGGDASHQVLELLARGEAVPGDIYRQARLAGPEQLRSAAMDAMIRGEGNAYRQAVRVVRTEINRAYGQAFKQTMAEHPDVIAVRFKLSPRHPRPDECDMHAAVNRYGLGPGVYPIDRSPWPAHPETFSYEEPVFRDEIPEDAAAGKQDRLAWLRGQPRDVQTQVLGGIRKRRAFERGWISERSIRTPWRILQKRLLRQGLPVNEIDPSL